MVDDLAAKVSRLKGVSQGIYFVFALVKNRALNKLINMLLNL